MRPRPLALLLLLAAPPSARAAGFGIAEQGARATGLADAVTASAVAPSAIHFNPAGLAALPGLQLYLGGNLILPRAEFTQLGTAETTAARGRVFATPAAFLSYRASASTAVGVGIYSPYGLGITWPRTWAGRGELIRADLQTVFISPVVAADLGAWVPGLGVAAGVDVVPAAVQLRRALVFGDTDGAVRLGGTAIGTGGRVGVRYAPPWLPGGALGLSWRSPVELRFAGEADLDAPDPFRATLPPDGAAETQLTLPHTLSAGVSYALLPALTVMVDVNWVGWSSYEELALTFADGSVSVAPKGWRDAVALRAGVEVTLDDWRLRAGYAFDPTPVPARRLDPTLPDGDRHVVSLGAGIALPAAMFADLGLLWVLPFDRRTGERVYEPPLKGLYEVEAWVISASVGWRFAPAPAEPEAPPPAAPVEEPPPCAAPPPTAPVEEAPPPPAPPVEETPAAPVEEAPPPPAPSVEETPPPAAAPVEETPAPAAGDAIP